MDIPRDQWRQGYALCPRPTRLKVFPQYLQIVYIMIESFEFDALADIPSYLEPAGTSQSSTVPSAYGMTFSNIIYLYANV